jgi:hypothetical protein
MQITNRPALRIPKVMESTVNTGKIVTIEYYLGNSLSYVWYRYCLISNTIQGNDGIRFQPQ